VIEGYEEVSSEQAEQIISKLIEPFFTEECVRAIMGRRDANSLRGDLLRWQELQRPLPPAQTPLDQFIAFSKQYHPTATHLTASNLQSFQKLLPNYRWNHFFINAFFFDRALSRPDVLFSELIAQGDIEQCCKQLIMRPNVDNQPVYPFTDEDLENLMHIAQLLDDTWTEEMLISQLRLRLNAIEPLFACGAVHHFQGGRYMVASGLRELIRSA
jgi:hypothetical protein